MARPAAAVWLSRVLAVSTAVFVTTFASRGWWDWPGYARMGAGQEQFAVVEAGAERQGRERRS